MTQSPQAFIDPQRFPMTTALMQAAMGVPPGPLAKPPTPAMAQRALELGIFPLFYRWAAAMHPQAQSLLEPSGQGHWRAHQVRTMLLRHVMRDVARDLQQAAMPFAILKGQTLSISLYGDRDLRDGGDLDLLLLADDLPQACALLARQGYHPKPGSFARPAVSNEFSLYHDRLGQPIELHWALALPQVPSPGPRTLFDRIAHVELEPGMLLPVLDAEMTLLHLAYHFHHHCGFLKGLFDVAAWLDRHSQSADLRWIEDKARTLGIAGLVQWPLHALAELTGLRPAMHQPRVSLPVRLWALQFARSVRGCLRRETPYRGHELATFKTQNTGEAYTFGLMMLAAQTLDRPTDRLHTALYPLILGPQALAEAQGIARPTPEHYLKAALRPVRLLKRLVRPANNASAPPGNDRPEAQGAASAPKAHGPTQSP